MRLVKAGIVRPVKRPEAIRETLDTPPIKRKSGASVLAGLLEERRAGR
jgi:hypothetical protein